jgi:hypothetical protein
MTARYKDEPSSERVGGVVRFNRAGYTQLGELADARGQSVEDFLRDAIGLIQWFDDILDEGGSIVARPAHGPWRVLRKRPEREWLKAAESVATTAEPAHAASGEEEETFGWVETKRDPQTQSGE